MLMVYIPAPTANPMPAVAHIPAAVVSPLTICFWKMMVPAPMNPIPLTLAGLELLSLIFKSIGMKSSVITFSTSSKEILPQVSRRFNSKDYLVVSYNLDRQVQGEYTNYQVTMVIKSKKSYDEGYLLQLMQEFPEVTVEKIE